MANPTTNYGFVLPTSSDLVTDLPADFDVALQGVDTRLKALQPGTTLGDLAYSSATANTNTRLGIGSTGQVLTVSGGVPAWATPVSAKVLQVVAGTTSTLVSNSTNTLADTTLTATITPSATTSKILVIATNNGCQKNSGNTANELELNLFRGATSLGTTAAGYQNVNATHEIGTMTLMSLDSPATISATTYKTQFRNVNNSASVHVQGGTGVVSTIILMEIGA